MLYEVITIIIMGKEELEKRIVLSPDGEPIEIDPINDYFCQDLPEVEKKSSIAILEKFQNWARSRSLWVLGFGTRITSYNVCYTKLLRI